MDEFIGSGDYIVEGSNSTQDDTYATWLIEGDENTQEPNFPTTEFQIPYDSSSEAAEVAFMDLEEPDALFWVYLAILLTITLLTFLLAIISCSVIADIRRQKDDATCCLDEMEDDQDKNCDDENVASYMATVGHSDPRKLEAQYHDVVKKYLKQQKKMRP